MFRLECRKQEKRKGFVWAANSLIQMAALAITVLLVARKVKLNVTQGAFVWLFAGLQMVT